MAKTGRTIELETGSMEAYIHKLIGVCNARLTDKDNPPTLESFQYYSGAKNFLYMVLTGYNNSLSNPKEEQPKVGKSNKT